MMTVALARGDDGDAAAVVGSDDLVVLIVRDRRLQFTDPPFEKRADGALVASGSFADSGFVVGFEQVVH